VTLREAEAAYRAAQQEAERLRVIRNAKLVEAVKAGYSLRQISEATGISRTRIHQIKES
jgi:hypothetical protein